MNITMPKGGNSPTLTSNRDNTEYTQSDTELLWEIQRDHSATHRQMQKRFESKTGKPYPF